MPFSFVKISSQMVTGTSPTTCAFTGGNAAGDLLVFLAVSLGNGVNAQFITGITDTQGNSWQSAGFGIADDSNNNATYTIWYAVAKGGSGTNTLSVARLTGHGIEGYGMEYSGNPAAQTTSFARGNNSGNNASATITPAVAASLIVGVSAYQGGGQNYSSSTAGLTFRTGVTNQQFVVYDILSSVAGSTTVTISNGAGPGIAVASFSPPAATGVPNGLMLLGIGT